MEAGCRSPGRAYSLVHLVTAYIKRQRNKNAHTYNTYTHFHADKVHRFLSRCSCSALLVCVLTFWVLLCCIDWQWVEETEKWVADGLENTTSHSFNLRDVDKDPYVKLIFSGLYRSVCIVAEFLFRQKTLTNLRKKVILISTVSALIIVQHVLMGIASSCGFYHTLTRKQCEKGASLCSRFILVKTYCGGNFWSNAGESPTQKDTRGELEL